MFARDGDRWGDPRAKLLAGEKPGGEDLGQGTLRSGASSAQVAKKVPAGTHYRLILFPASHSSRHYDVSGSVQTQH